MTISGRPRQGVFQGPAKIAIGLSDYGSGKCLVATYSYRIAGGGSLGAASPVNETISVNHKRDSLGPYYNDIEPCQYNAGGQIVEWCEGSATHV